MTPIISWLKLHLNSLILAAGLSLLPLLPIGMELGFSRPWFVFFELHLILMLAAVAGAIGLLVELVHNSLPRARQLSKLAFIVFACVIVAQALLPITAKDALIHHLAVPKWWIEAGRIAPVSWHTWSYYPMLLQLAFAGFLKLRLEALTPFYHFLYLILLSAATASFLQRRFSDSMPALFGALMIFVLPICINLASTPLVDLGLALFCAVACFNLADWLNEQRLGHLVSAGLALGLALGTKPNALLACALLMPLFLLGAKRANAPLKLAIPGIILCTALALLAFLPWMLKNMLWVNNPLYPMLQGVFGGQTEVLAQAPSGLSPLQQRRMLYGEDWFSILLLPLRIFIDGQDENPALFDGKLSPLLLLSLLSIPYFRKNPWSVMLFLFSLFYLFFALFLTGARVRYLAPVYAPLAALSALGLVRAADLINANRRSLVFFSAMLLQSLLSLSYAYGLITRSGTLDYLTSEQTRRDYLMSHLEEYPAIAYINSKLPRETTVYLLFTGNRFYYYRRPVITSGYASGNAFISWARTCPDAECLAQEIRSRGATYILTHWPRTSGIMESSLEGKAKTVWYTFLDQYIETVLYANNHALWRINRHARMCS